LASIIRIRPLKGVGILADQTSSQASAVFLRYNLIYGFNGSGKSTLSRLFSCLQSNKVHPDLPDSCDFGFEFSDGTFRNAPDQLSGFEERICVFNVDFIERNLRWNQGTANSIFYISEEQAEAAAALRAAEADLPIKAAAFGAAEDGVRERSQTLATLKRGLAKTIAGKLHLANRKYEAPQLQSDYEAMTFDASSILAKEALDEYESVASRSSPPPSATPIEVSLDGIPGIVALAIQHAAATIGEAMVAELVAHPTMVPWARTGYEYHAGHELNSCLFCGSILTQERRAVLAGAFDETLSRFIKELTAAQEQAASVLTQVESALQAAQQVSLMPEVKLTLERANKTLTAAILDMRALFSEIHRLYDKRKSAPTSPIKIDMPEPPRVLEICNSVAGGVELVNAVIEQHNNAAADFGNHQQAARDAIRKHFLAENHAEYQTDTEAVIDGEMKKEGAALARANVLDQIAALRTTVRTHGPAAATITKLAKAYLGHGELTVVPLNEGYELHRHGKLVKGPPSEGEKTALALCYFLSTLAADGRKTKDLIVVIDDPISSLDTRAMNYACALIRTQL
jgi:wobble nucleotide-excising tRNase